MDSSESARTEAQERVGERDAPYFLVCVRRNSYGERNVEVSPGEEQAGDEADTRYLKRDVRA